MYEYVKGVLVESSPIAAVIDVGGVGYKVLIPASAFANLPAKNQEVMLYTSFIVRDISQTLYGFTSRQERDLFEEVLCVSGIGPKIALSLIGHLPISDLHQAISNNDFGAISKVPGIGRKTAERLVIEMRDKLAKGGFVPNLEEFAVKLKKEPKIQKIQDAMHALINLGYTQVAAQKAVKSTLEQHGEEIALPNLITAALKHF